MSRDITTVTGVEVRGKEPMEGKQKMYFARTYEILSHAHSSLWLHALASQFIGKSDVRNNATEKYRDIS